MESKAVRGSDIATLPDRSQTNPCLLQQCLERAGTDLSSSSSGRKVLPTLLLQYSLHRRPSVYCYGMSQMPEIILKHLGEGVGGGNRDYNYFLKAR